MSGSRLVLLVEDNAMDAELAIDAFRQSGASCDVHVCPSGEAALEYLAGGGGPAGDLPRALPDLVLLDLQLPGLDGPGLLRRIRDTPRLRRLPVVALTTSSEAADVARCYDLGVNSYLVKPVSFDDFLVLIRHVQQYWLETNVGPPGESATPVAG